MLKKIDLMYKRKEDMGFHAKESMKNKNSDTQELPKVEKDEIKVETNSNILEPLVKIETDVEVTQSLKTEFE